MQYHIIIYYILFCFNFIIFFIFYIIHYIFYFIYYILYFLYYILYFLFFYYILYIIYYILYILIYIYTNICNLIFMYGGYWKRTFLGVRKKSKMTIGDGRTLSGICVLCCWGLTEAIPRFMTYQVSKRGWDIWSICEVSWRRSDGFWSQKFGWCEVHENIKWQQTMSVAFQILR